MLVTPIGRITSLDSASDIDAAYPSGNGGGVLGVKEILRASIVKIDNASDKPVCARVVRVNGLNTTTGEAYAIFQQNNIETFNYHDMIIAAGETAYIRKEPTQTTLVDPNVPTYADQPASGGETIQIRLAPNQTAGTGYVYASPVTIVG
tara:strand:- start:135 stop:581 length:447 start_codon:yes stop_codon:yes gene_type:complete